MIAGQCFNMHYYLENGEKCNKNVNYKKNRDQKRMFTQMNISCKYNNDETLKR